MPFLRVDAYEGRSKKQVKELLDAIHRAILSAFGVPLRDRYQVYQEHSESNFVVQDTGLGIDRTRNVVFIGITSRQRTEVQKTMLYTKLVGELKTCGIEQNDIVVSIVTNSATMTRERRPRKGCCASLPARSEPAKVCRAFASM